MSKVVSGDNQRIELPEQVEILPEDCDLLKGCDMTKKVVRRAACRADPQTSEVDSYIRRNKCLRYRTLRLARRQNLDIDASLRKCCRDGNGMRHLMACIVVI